MQGSREEILPEQNYSGFGFDPLELWLTPTGKCQNWTRVGFGQFTAK